MSFGQEVKDFIGAFQAGSSAVQRGQNIDLERQKLSAQTDYLKARQDYLTSKQGGSTTVQDPATAAGDAARQQYQGGKAGDIGASGSNLDRAKQAFNYFAPIYGTAGAAGIVGNWMQESSFAEDVIDGSRRGDKTIKGGSFGLAQWNRERLQALNEFADKRGKPISDFQTQLEFANHELQNSEASVGNALKTAKNAGQAAQIFLGYERPKGYKPGGNPGAVSGWGNRLASANNVFQQFAGGAPTTPQATPTQTDTASGGGAIPAPAARAAPQQQAAADDGFDKNGKATPFAPLQDPVQVDTSQQGGSTTVAPPTPIPGPAPDDTDEDPYE